MAFTTATVASYEQGNRDNRGIWSDVWTIVLTVDPSSIAAGAEDIATFTIPNLALGDMVLGYVVGINQTVDADINVWVSAANTLSVRISNLNGASALDLASNTWKVVVGRPAF